MITTDFCLGESECEIEASVVSSVQDCDYFLEMVNPVGALNTYQLELIDDSIQPLVTVDCQLVSSCHGPALVDTLTSTALTTYKRHLTFQVLQDGGYVTELEVWDNLSNTPTLLDLNPFTSPYLSVTGACASGVVSSSDLIFDSGNPNTMEAALTTLIENALCQEFSAVNGTDYELVITVLSNGFVGIRFTNKHNPTGQWIGLNTTGIFNYSIDGVNFVNTTFTNSIILGATFLCNQTTPCGGLSLFNQSTFTTAISSINSIYNEIVLTGFPQPVGVPTSNPITCQTEKIFTLSISGCDEDPTITWEYDSDGNGNFVPLPPVAVSLTGLTATSQGNNDHRVTISCGECLLIISIDSSDQIEVIESSGVICEVCLVPVSGKHACVKICFISPDAEIQPCTFAQTTIEITDREIALDDGFSFDVNGQPNPIELTVNGGTAFDGYTLLEPHLTTANRATSFIQSFNSNPVLALKYNIESAFNTPLLSTITITARECGTVCDLEVTPIGDGFTPTIVNTPAQDQTLKENHNVWVQFYCVENEEEKPVNQKIYPLKFNSETGLAQSCPNLASTLECYINCPKPDKTNGGILLDNSIVKRMSIKHAEIYGEGTNPTPYGLTDLGTFDIFPGTPQKNDLTDYNDFCNPNNQPIRFLTNAPLNEYHICCDTCLILSFYIPDSFVNISAQADVYFTDGSSNLGLGLDTQLLEEGPAIAHIAAGLGNSTVLCQLENVDYYVITANYGSADVDLVTTEQAIIHVDRNCGCTQQFFFTNDFGVTDTILFNCPDVEDIVIETTEFCEWADCGDAVCEGDNQVASINSYDSFSAISLKHYKYCDKEWLKEFYRSKWKGTIEKGQMVTVLPTAGQFAIARRGKDNIQSIFSYRYNYDNATK